MLITERSYRGGQLPQSHLRVFAAGEQILGVLREHRRADFLAAVCAFERVDATIGDAIPDLERAVFRRRSELLAVRRPFHAGDRFGMLILRLRGDETSAGCHVVQSRDWMLRADEQPVAARMETQAADLIDFGDRTRAFLRCRLGVFEEFDRVITRAGDEKRFVRMEIQAGDFVGVIVQRTNDGMIVDGRFHRRRCVVQAEAVLD